VSDQGPLNERPAARPATPPLTKRGIGCLGIVWLTLGVVVLAIILIIIVNVIASANNPAKVPLNPEVMMADCVSQVAEWAGVSPGQVTATDVSAENSSGGAWDFRGTYPDGEWACGGTAGDLHPAQTMVYPGGADSTDVNDIPEQIYP